MAKNRYVNTAFWTDPWVTELEISGKMLFLYLLTNPMANIAGVYELTTKRIVFDTGLTKTEVEKLLKDFESDGKIKRFKQWVAITNFLKHQALNPKVRKGVETELAKAPPDFVASIDLPAEIVPYDHNRLSIDSDSLSHSNTNRNNNLKRTPDSQFPSELGKSLARLTREKSVRRAS